MRRAICLSGTNRNTSSVATVLICVISAILYVAFDPLYVLRHVTCAFLVNLFVFHHSYLFFS